MNSEARVGWLGTASAAFSHCGIAVGSGSAKLSGPGDSQCNSSSHRGIKYFLTIRTVVAVGVVAKCAIIWVGYPGFCFCFSCEGPMLREGH